MSDMKNHSPLRGTTDTNRARTNEYDNATKQNVRVEQFLEDLGNNELKSSIKKSSDYMPLREKSPDQKYASQGLIVS